MFYKIFIIIKINIFYKLILFILFINNLRYLFINSLFNIINL